MKPLKLVLSAFGPFGNVVEIPFEDIGPNGLFLINGDTGAGKTTIFDAISFALFGNASGDSRTTDFFRSDYAKNEEKTYVELIFLHRDLKYHIMRNPIYKRNKVKGNGTTEEKANATLTMPDGSVISGYTYVTEAVNSLLGIDWKQFKQIAMIAQGEFLQLITANSSERGAIFRKVFNTHIYDDIQKKLKSMSIQLKNQCDDIDKSILQFLSGMVCEEENVHMDAIQDWKKTKDIHQINKIMELLLILIKIDRETFQHEKERNDSLTIEIKDKNTEYLKAEQDNKLLANQRKLKEDYKNLMQSEEEMKIKEAKCNLANKAFCAVKPAEDNYKRIQKEVVELKTGIDRGSVECQKLEADLYIHSKAYQETEHTIPKINELTKDINRQEEERKKYQMIDHMEREKIMLEEKKHKIVHKSMELKNRKEMLNQELVVKRQEQDSYCTVEADLVVVENQLKEHQDRMKQINDIIMETSDLEKENSNLQKCIDNFQRAEATYHEQNTIYLKGESLFLREQAGIIASTLQMGAPCPVCGSKEHPQKAVITEGAPSDKQLKEDKAKLEYSHKAMIEANNQCSNQKMKVDMLQGNLRKLANKILDIDESSRMDELFLLAKDELQKIKDILIGLKEKENNLKQQFDRKNVCAQRLHAISEELSIVEDQINQNNNEVNDITSKLSGVLGTLETLRKDLTYATEQEAAIALEKLRIECSRLQDALVTAESTLRRCENELGSKKAVLTDNQMKYEKRLIDLEASEKEYRNKIATSGFTSELAYHESLMEEEDLEVLKQEIASYYKTVELLTKQLEQLKFETENKIEKNLDDILSQQKELDQMKLQCEERMQKIYSRLEINEDIHCRVGERNKEQEKKRQEYLTISDLSKTASGELSGKAKIAFEQYVQAFYFDSVIREANKRLYKMSNHQYALQRKTDASNLRSLSGLELEVMDYYTGKARSIKSLSGGESFKAALSLALGLSDVIQSFAGGIEIDAMFIDEGFGSLDSNSLEQAIETLNSLTSGNRMVGIISHVSELKERIERKILIRKSMEGSSLSLIM